MKRETDGFNVITIGSSAGGYASALFGPKLKAEKVICFNAQFSLDKLVEDSTETNSPLLYSMLKGEMSVGGGEYIENQLF